MKPKLSVVIPMFNEKRYIERCLNSLLSQSFKSFEIILVDDGSTDGTYSLVKSVYSKKKNIRLFSQKNQGPGVARNFGASKAKGDILIFVDADMMFDKNYLQYLIKPIIKGKEFGTTHGTEKVANLENVWARSWSIDRIPNPPKRSAVFRAIKTDIFLKHGGFNPSKGYFDDDLSHIGSGLVVRKAICYHNNPETIKEAFKHSVWVGRGIYITGSFHYYLQRFKLFFVLFVAVLAVQLLFARKNLMAFFIIAFIITSIVIYLQVLIRTVKEKYISHLIYVPIIWVIRLCGYAVGFFKEKFTNQ